VTLGLAVTGCAAPPPRHPRRLRLMLPPPSGPYQAGTVPLHLVDHSRRDPWLAGNRPRELMVSLWYPAMDDDRYPQAPWMPPKAGALFLTQLIPSPLTGPFSTAPAPRISLDGDDRALGTGLVSDLASRGYVVVTTDYTYEAAEVQFPAGLAGALDLARTGMFGHSLGGATAAEVMAADRRILAGIDLDGTIIVSGLPAPGDQASLTQVKYLAAAVARRIGDRPFMIMTHAGHGPRDDVTLAGFWANLNGWRLFLTLTDSGHYSYTDDEEFLSQLGQARIIPPRLASQVITPASRHPVHRHLTASNAHPAGPGGSVPISQCGHGRRRGTCGRHPPARSNLCVVAPRGSALAWAKTLAGVTPNTSLGQSLALRL
jgi:hypothetical protein